MNRLCRCRIGKNADQNLIFVRGFQGVPGKSGCSSFWFRRLRKYGYQGNIYSYSWWSASMWLCFSPTARYNLALDAGDELWDQIQRRQVDPRTISLMGFSMGSVVIQQLLWQARRAGEKFRRLYLFGGSASNEERWGDLL